MRSTSIAPILFATAAIAALSLTGCSSSSSTSGSSTGGIAAVLHNIGIGNVKQGVAVEVRRAPIAPGTRPGTDSSAPLAGAHVRVLLGEDVVGDLVTDEQGQVGTELDPGTYTLQPLPFATSEWPKPPASVSLVVPSRGKASATIVYDTGIR
jgi:hypothetical protein